MKIDKSKPSHLWALFNFSIVCFIAFIKRKALTKQGNKPIILLYGHKLNSNLKALYLELEKHSDKYEFYFLTMDKKYYQTLKQENISTLNACSLTTISQLANTSVIVTDHGLHCLELFLGRCDIKFMDVWHGLPFKGFDKNDFKVQHKYDAICVTSEHLKNLYIEKFGFAKSKIKLTGYGRSDLLLSPPRKQSYMEYGIPDDGSKIILYAPTWKQDDANRSIYPFGTEERVFLNAINQVCEVGNAFFVVRTHLNSTETPSKNYGRILFRPHSDYPDTEFLLTITDILVCDWSSIALDYLVLRRPTFYLDVEPPFAKGLSLSKDCRAGEIISTKTELLKKLGDSLDGGGKSNKVIKEQQRATIELLYDKTNDGLSGKRYLREVNSLLES